MSSNKFDPITELPPNPILGMALVLVIAAFCTVGWIVFGDAKAQEAAQAEK
jgi:hypothetical protein